MPITHTANANPKDWNGYPSFHIDYEDNCQCPDHVRARLDRVQQRLRMEAQHGAILNGFIVETSSHAFVYPLVCLPYRPDDCECSWGYCPKLGGEDTPFVLKYSHRECRSKHVIEKAA